MYVPNILCVIKKQKETLKLCATMQINMRGIQDPVS